MSNTFKIPPGIRVPDTFCIVKGKRGNGYSIVAAYYDGFWTHSTEIEKIVSKENYWEIKTKSGSFYKLRRDSETIDALNNPFFPFYEEASTMEEAYVGCSC